MFNAFPCNVYLVLVYLIENCFMLYNTVSSMSLSLFQINYLTSEQINLDISKLQHLITVQEKLKESITISINELRFQEMPLLHKRMSIVKNQMVRDLINADLDISDKKDDKHSKKRDSEDNAIEFKTTEQISLVRPKKYEEKSIESPLSNEETEENLSDEGGYSEEEEGSEESYYGD